MFIQNQAVADCAARYIMLRTWTIEARLGPDRRSPISCGSDRGAATARTRERRHYRQDAGPAAARDSSAGKTDADRLAGPPTLQAGPAPRHARRDGAGPRPDRGERGTASRPRRRARARLPGPCGAGPGVLG